MRRSLTWKFSLAFLAVSLTGVALVAYFAGRITTTAFDRFRLEEAQENFVAEVSVYYRLNEKSWEGVDANFRKPLGGNLPPPRQGDRPPPRQGDRLPPPPPPQNGGAGSSLFGNPGQPPQFVLVDLVRTVLVPAPGYRIGDQVSEEMVAQGEPLYIDGEQVGTVLCIEDVLNRDPQTQLFLWRIVPALMIAAAIATAIALLLGIILTRTLIRPLRELTAATQALTVGSLEQQVPVRTQDELGELAASFNRMSADLAEANRLRRQMTADIAHDLRTPLTVLAGYIESLRDGVLRPNPEMFEVMHDEAQHLQGLVEDLRTLSLADADELRLTLQPVAPQELLERVAVAYGHQTQQMDIEMQVKAETNLPKIQIDPDRMVRVLGNLVNNALRYTPAGGRITLSAHHNSEAIWLSVQDTGSGIPTEALPHIFHRFYRADAARQQQNGESGLGLAIAKSLIEAHGGTISAESELGQGTTMIIRLPYEAVT